MLHWLLPLVAAMSLLTSSVTTWAAAGFFGEAECCCPVKTDCKCHDHDGKPDPTPKTATPPAIVQGDAAAVTIIKPMT